MIISYVISHSVRLSQCLINGLLILKTLLRINNSYIYNQGYKKIHYMMAFYDTGHMRKLILLYGDKRSILNASHIHTSIFYFWAYIHLYP